MMKQYLLKINDKVYYFKLNGASLIELENRYGSDNAFIIINMMLQRRNPEQAFIKILACSCKNERISEDFLKENLVWNKQLLNIYTEVTMSIMQGYSNGFKQSVENMKTFINELGKLDKKQQEEVISNINKTLRNKG